jgi:hypothetical protein
MHIPKVRLAAVAVPALTVAIMTFAACQDAITDSPSSTAVITALPSVPAASTRAAQARQDIHARNSFDWVGVAHNQTIEAFRKELRKPGRVAPRLCEYVADFSTRAERVPVERRGGTRSDPSVQRAELTNALCKGESNAVSVRPVSLPSGQLREFSVSPSAYQLLDEARAAIENSVDSYDLAARLSPLIARAGSLDSLEQALSYVALSVAQNSFEYWEAELPRLVQEVQVEYGDCFDKLYYDGFTPIDPIAYCDDLHSGYISFPVPRPRIPRMSLAALPLQEKCPVGHAWQTMKRVARVDLDGAAIGFFGAAVTMKSIPIAVEVAIGAAGGRSIWEALQKTYEIWACAMGRRT